jgi:hypothetical protein
MKILYSKIAYDKIIYWVKKCPVEISGFGTVQYLPDTKTFYVTDAYLIKQEGRAATTDIDGAALSKLMYEKRNEVGNCKLWWHSHVNMAAFWSGTDTATIRELGSQGWIVASVFNKREEVQSAYCCKTTSELGDSVYMNEKIPTEMEVMEDEELKMLCEAEYTAQFSEYRAPVTPVMYGDYEQGWWKKGNGKGKKHKQPSLLVPDDSNAAISYAIIEEARALGMKPWEYEQMINNASQAELMEIDNRLNRALNK